jgi:hypothetical protein
MTSDPGILSWIARERAIEDLLPGSISHNRAQLLARLEEYASAVVAAVRAEPESGSVTPPDEDTWLERPVFVCGAHRSGTTLMQSLLDGHPELVVLPNEATYLTSFRYVARARPSQRDVDRFIAEWIARLIDPNDVPHFRLGRSSRDRSPAVEFCRAMLKWNARLQATVSHTRFNPLLALVAAYREVTAPQGAPRMWVEKTPLNEHYAPLLLQSFAKARCIQLIRDPLATFASHYAAYVAENLKGFDRFGTVQTIGRSLRLAARHAQQWADRYLVVRYEDLTDNLEREIERICRFLEIKTDPVLLSPSAGGAPVQSNSSFRRSSPGVVATRRDPDISARDARLVAGVAGSEARLWNYSVTPLGVGAVSALKLRNMLSGASKLSRRWLGK